MTQRLDFTSLSADAYKGMLAIHAGVDGSGLDKGLIELLRLRISQINGCAYCISMHVTVGRKHGLSEEINSWNRLMIAVHAPPKTIA
jgi:AhpD family alkylhydroperoxidase